MSAPKLLDRLRTKQVECEYSAPRPQSATDRQTERIRRMAAEFDAGAAYRQFLEQVQKHEPLNQTQRIRALSKPLDAHEVRRAWKSIRPGVVSDSLDRLELALCLAAINQGFDPSEILRAVRKPSAPKDK